MGEVWIFFRKMTAIYQERTVKCCCPAGTNQSRYAQVLSHLQPVVTPDEERYSSRPDGTLTTWLWPHCRGCCYRQSVGGQHCAGKHNLPYLWLHTELTGRCILRIKPSRVLLQLLCSLQSAQHIAALARWDLAHVMSIFMNCCGKYVL